MKLPQYKTWYGGKMHRWGIFETKDGFEFVPPIDLRAPQLQNTGLKDKNGKEIYEGDVVGKEEVYHFIDRNGWQPKTGNWKIIGEKTKNFTGKKEEKYIAGYELSVVEWKDKSCGFEPFSDSEKNCGHCGGGKDPIEVEVIGNIYENPELLK